MPTLLIVKIRDAFEFLSGKKTYIVCLVTILYAYGINRNWWPHDPAIDLLFGSGGAITLRMAMNKLCRQLERDHFLEDLNLEKDLTRARNVLAAAPSDDPPGEAARRHTEKFPVNLSFPEDNPKQPTDQTS